VVTLIAVLAGSSATGFAEPITKEQCVEAHGRGQDAKEQGKLSLARKVFMTCAQSACPALIQGDCARFANELDQIQPTVSFAARESSSGSDLPDTAVYIDGALVLTRLDDGKSHDIDPGKHEIRFANNGRDQAMTIVIGSGEKGRTILAKFEPLGGTPARSTDTVTPDAPRRRKETSHPGGAKALIALGSVALIGGGVFGVLGVAKIPAGCSLSTHQCSAPPGDPVFAEASKGVRWADIGFSIAGAGAIALTSGLVWYFTGAKTHETDDGGLATWVTPSGAGVSFTGRL
jgi:hypothetical protein